MQTFQWLEGVFTQLWQYQDGETAGFFMLGYALMAGELSTKKYLWCTFFIQIYGGQPLWLLPIFDIQSMIHSEGLVIPKDIIFK